MADERIALIIETQARLDALRASIMGTQELGQAAQRTSAQTASTGTALARVGSQGPNVRQTANAVSALAYAAEASTLGARAAVTAFGNLAQQVALVSSSARFAAMASGIGAVVVVAGTLVGLLTLWKDRARDAAKSEADLRAELEGLNASLSGDRLLERRLALVRATELEAERISEQVKDTKRRADLLELIYEKQARGIQLLEQEHARAEAERQRQLNEQVTSMSERIRQENDLAHVQRAAAVWGENSAAAALDMEKLRASQNYENRVREIEQLFVIRDEEGQIVKLTREQVAERERLLALAGETRDVILSQIEDQDRRRRQSAAATIEMETAEIVGGERLLEARLAAIERERQANIAATGDVTAANELAELKKRQLMRDTYEATKKNLGAISEALLSSNNRMLRSLGHFADTFRRLIIGAEASRAAVKSAVAFAEVPGFLAVGDVRGAAFAFASGTQLAAAAALGFKEALGGGGGGGGGGAGGGGASAPTDVFTPRSEQGGGTVVLNLYSANPLGREMIQQAIWQIRRAEVLDQDIALPPTFGIVSDPRLAS